MATYTSSQVASGQIPINERGASFIVFGSIALTTALANNDIVQLVTVPFVFIVANNYIIAPYAQALSGASVSLPTPPDLWALIKIGLGGYVVGRSAEKCVAAWKN
jgi:hypothetical protein